MPLPALITSHIRLGSRPAFTPMAIASELAAMPVAERKLLASFMLCASPGLSPHDEHLAEHLERGPHLLDLLGRARHHDGERALLGAGDAAADRAVDLHDAAFFQDLGRPDRGARAGGGEVDVAPHAIAANEPVVAGRNLQPDVERGQAGHHGLDPVGDVGRRFRRGRADLGELGHRLGPGVEHRELMAGLDQTPTHWAAHVAQADEPDFHPDPPEFAPARVPDADAAVIRAARRQPFGSLAGPLPR